jgi:large subunit ribosomal protein L25
MAAMTLQARVRERAPKSQMNEERKNGAIAAVMYGHGQAATMLWIERLAFEKLYAIAGESTIISLDISGKKKNILVHDVSFDPLSHRANHIDFMEVKMNEIIEVAVPLEFVGVAPAVKELGGILIKTLEEVEVSCLPKDLPQHLSVDLQLLKTFDQSIHVGDIVLPEGVKMLTGADTVVATADEPRSAEELASLNEKVEGDVTKVEGVVKPEAEKK